MFSHVWDVDRAQGMIWGAMIADAVGAAYEHSRAPSPLALPSPLIAQSWKYHRQYAPAMIVTPAGMITDDSEMTLASLAALEITNYADDGDFGDYHHSLELHYVRWGMSKCPFGGRNTRKYLYGITTSQGLRARIKRFRERNEHAESNGFLMRASPFALLEPACDDASIYSAEITGNYNANCARMFREYVGALRGCLARPVGDPHVDPADFHPRATSAQVAARDTKGWGECAILCCRDYFEWVRTHAGSPDDTYMTAIRTTIARGGDTDTNGCIVGALAGARFGLERMLAQSREVAENIALIRACHPVRMYDTVPPSIADPARPREYWASRADELIARIAGMRGD